jgi:hypothetical protein
MLRVELSTQTICVHPLPCGSDEALVSADEPGDTAGRRALQCADRPALAAAARRRSALALCVPCVAVVRPQGCAVRLGADRIRVARLGLFGLEGCKAKGQGMVHPETAHLFAGRWPRADAALVDSRGAAARTILGDDWKVSRCALASGVGRGAGRGSAPVQQLGIARLPAGSWEGAEHSQRGIAVASLDDDRGGLVNQLLNALRILSPVAHPHPPTARYEFWFRLAPIDSKHGRQLSIIPFIGNWPPLQGATRMGMLRFRTYANRDHRASSGWQDYSF